MDPHGAVSYLALKQYLELIPHTDIEGILFETAHPAKFGPVVEEELNFQIEIPVRLQECLNKKKKSIKISKNFNDLKKFLLNGAL
jgi:threonine synthase